ncbi:hypothetical protein Mapa_000971 [Marchantia paleacea]|nr:hypothetical protein Mapa_000971 [Marchantia paleacea]
MTQMMLSKRYFEPKVDSESTAKNEEFSRCVDEVIRLTGAPNVGDYIPFLKYFHLQGNRKAMMAARTAVDNILKTIFFEHRKGTAHQTDGLRDFVDVLLEFQKTERCDNRRNGYVSGVAGVVHGGDHSKSQNDAQTAGGVGQRGREGSSGGGIGHSQSEVPRGEREGADAPACVAPLLIPHESTASCTIGGYDIPAEVQVIGNVYAVHRDPALWDSPDEFRPERFLDSDVDVKGQHFQLLPFGGGTKDVLGGHLGLAHCPVHGDRPPADLRLESSRRAESGGRRYVTSFGAVLGMTKPLKLMPPLVHFCPHLFT